MATNCEVMTKLGQNWQRSDCADICDKTAEFYNGPIMSALHQRHYTYSYTRQLFSPDNFFHFHCGEFRAESGLWWGGEGGMREKCDLVRADCKNFALLEKVCILIKLWVGKGKLVFVCFGIWELPKIFWDCASPYKSRCQKWTQAHLYTGDMTDTHLGSHSQNRMSRVLKI